MILTKRAAEFKAVTHVTHRFFQRSRHSLSTLFIIQLRSLSQSKFEYLSSTRQFKSQYFHRYQWWSFFFCSVSMFQFWHLFRKVKKSFEFSFRRYNGCTQGRKELYSKFCFQIQNWKLKNDHHSFLERESFTCQNHSQFKTFTGKGMKITNKILWVWLFNRVFGFIFMLFETNFIFRLFETNFVFILFALMLFGT